jgi:hypothetical protein
VVRRRRPTLLIEFEDRHPLPAILEVIKQCRAQLDISPGPALPEPVEQLGRQRLTTTA